MPLDLIVRNARIAGRDDAAFDVGIAGGRIAEVSPAISSDAPVEDVAGRLVIPGFVETHIHLDKSCILDRCRSEEGTLQEAIAEVAAAKRAFTEEDVYARGRRTLEKAIVQGTTRMRTHVEVDPRVGLTSFDAIRRLKADYRLGHRSRDLRVSAGRTAQRSRRRGAADRGLQAGADLIGGCPYTDSNPHGQIDRIFAMLGEFDLDIDFHLDFDLDASWMDIDEVCRQTECAPLWRPRRGRSRHQAVRAAARAVHRGRAAAGGCRRRRHGAALDRPVPDGTRARSQRPARRCAGAPAAPARRHLLARHQQRAQSVHAVRRLLARADGEPVRQHRAARPDGGACRLLRHGDDTARRS